MATSSIQKTFSLNGREEVNAFMNLFEEALRTPPKLEEPMATIATESDVQEMIKNWKQSNSK